MIFRNNGPDSLSEDHIWRLEFFTGEIIEFLVVLFLASKSYKSEKNEKFRNFSYCIHVEIHKPL